MRLPQFTFRHWMVFVAILGVVLATPLPTVEAGVVLLLVLVVPALVISQLPPRVRLAVEITILLALVLLKLWLWQSGFYAREADRTAQLACRAYDWAAVSKSPQARAILRGEAAWFARRAVTLRVKALWKGILHGPKYPSGRLSRQDHGRLLDELWEIQRHEDAARQAHERSFPGGSGP